MIPVLSRDQIRALDAWAIDRCCVPSLVLMENAGTNAARVILGVIGDAGIDVVIVAGSGNNGGDGFVVARRLLCEGKNVEVFLLGSADKLKGEVVANYDAWRGLGGVIREINDDAGVSLLEKRLDELGSGDLVVDALLGTGLDRDVEGRLARVIEAVNSSAARRIALDIPSGVDSNTGRPLGVAVRAEATVTFGHLKLGLLTSSGAEHAGTIHVVDIGVPSELFRHVGHSALVIESADVARELSPRSVSAHKSSVGHVLAVAGSAGKTGAALLVARAALRAGAGLCTIASFRDAADALDRRVVEEMTARINPNNVEGSLDEALERVQAVVIGPGLGLDADARRVVDHVVLGWNGPKVLDADALTHFAGRAAELQRAPGTLVLTPHPGELARLLGESTSAIEANRFEALKRAVELTGATVVLKGPRTLIGAAGELPLVNVAGTPALATAGSGDVLSGILGAFSLSLPPRVAAFASVFVHAASGERWSERTGADRGLVAGEIADGVPALLAELAGTAPRSPV
jgi:NAD(P)H-hydrate epimerase